ncbi:MAG TPA: hypothetical protein VLH75_06425 [Longimicrobiales bacterium]|nr:hypothetical protein [Longimicrobiales bacterium]
MAACWAAVALSLALQAAGVARRNVHPDEFIFLANVHSWVRGEPMRLFQTAYVHLFAWLPGLEGDELAQVRAGRGILLAAWVASLALLHRLALHATDRVGAAAAVAIAALLGESLVHAASFRVDGLMAPVFLGACLAATAPGRRRLALSGALAGALVALSLKGTLLLPVIAGLVLLSLEGRRDRGPLALAAAAAFGFTLGGTLLLHAALLPSGPLPSGAPATEGEFLRNAASRMLLGGDALPNQATFLRSLLADLPAWACATVGVVAALRGLRQEGGWRRGWLVVLVAMPALLFLVYRNLWAYAFVSLLPTVWIAAGAGWVLALRSRARGARLAAWAAPAWLLLFAIPVARGLAEDGTRLQKQTLDVVHSLFPTPVPYVARVGMVASFPRPLFNLTGFGLETYRDRGVPELSRYVEAHQPPLLLMDSPTLAVFGDPSEAGGGLRPALLPEDAALLRYTFAHLWGPVYLAGRRWARLAAGEAHAFAIHVGGPFTLLASAGVTVDGAEVSPGGTVDLGVGPHLLVSGVAQADVALLWGRSLQVPAQAPAPGPLYAER